MMEKALIIAFDYDIAVLVADAMELQYWAYVYQRETILSMSLDTPIYIYDTDSVPLTKNQIAIIVETRQRGMNNIRIVEESELI